MIEHGVIFVKLFNTIIFLSGLLLFAVGCSDEADKPVTQLEKTQQTLAGTWFFDCWLDGDTDRFYESWEDRYLGQSNFEFVLTLYDNDDCSSNAVARVVFSGTYTLSGPIQASTDSNPTKMVSAWKINYDVENADIQGNKLIANAGINIHRFGLYYDLIHVDGNIKYDGKMDSLEVNRPTELIYTSDRVEKLLNIDLQPSPAYDTVNLASEFVGEWDDGCYNDGQSDGAEEYTELSLLRFPTQDTIEFEGSLWTDSGCKGSFVASLILTGTFSIYDTLQTANTDVTAAIIEISLAADTIYSGDPAAAGSLPYTSAAGKTSYMLVFYDANYDMLFYGGWREHALEELPDDFEWSLNRYGG